MQSLENKKAAYAAALTAFKRHEAWGWHLVSPFMTEASAKGLTPMEEQENSVIQEGIDTYHRLKEELRVAKRRLKNAQYKANRQARKKAQAQAQAQVVEPDIISITTEEVEEYMETRFPIAPQPVPQPVPQPKSYEQLVHERWQTENTHFYTALRKFRRFNAKGGKATFIVAKDGANYEDMSLDMEELTVAGLRLWASILQAPYASKLRRAQLEDLLCPVLATLAAGRPAYSSWVYL